MSTGESKLPYKPKSLDDINSLYDSDIAAARAIEQGKSKLKEDASSPSVNMPPENDGNVGAPGNVQDISSVVDDFIRAMNAGEISSKPSKIRIDTPAGVSPRKPSYRPGIHAPRTGVQSLDSQKAQSGKVVTNASARQTGDERPFRSAPGYEPTEGGPNYAKQKAAAEEARKAAEELEKQRRRDEYRRMITSENSERRTDEQMDEFLSEYSSVMNDEDEGRRSRRAKRREHKAETASRTQAPAPSPQQNRSSDGFEDFFHDVTDNIPPEERNKDGNIVQSSDFDDMFAETDMATLPYSAKQFIYEQKLMYEDQARRAKEEYERRVAEDYVRNKNEQDLLRAEQERIRREAEEQQKRDEQLLVEKEYEYKRQMEILEHKIEENAHIMEQHESRLSSEIEDLIAERDDLLARQEELVRQRDEELSAYNLKRESDIAALEMKRNEEIEKLTAERDDLIRQKDADLAELARQRDEEVAALMAKLEKQTSMYAEASAAIAAKTAERDAAEEAVPAEKPEDDIESSYSADAAVFNEYAQNAEGEATEEKPLDRKAEKQRLKEERALDRAAEKEMVREAKERAKAEKAAAKAAKKAKKQGAEQPESESFIAESEMNDETAEPVYPEDTAEPVEAAETFEEANEAEPVDIPVVPVEEEEIYDSIEMPVVPSADEEIYEPADNEVEAFEESEKPEKQKRGAVRVFFRTIFSLLLVALIIALAGIVSLDKVIKLNYGEKSLIGNCIFFTASESIEGTNINSGDLVIVRGADSAANGEVIAYVDREIGSYGFGTKDDVTIDSNGDTFYKFTQGEGIQRSKVVGIVQKTVATIGTYLALATRYSNLILIGGAAIALILFLIIVFAMRNRNKRKPAKNKAKKPSGEKAVREDIPAEAEEILDNSFDEIDDAAYQSEAHGETIPTDEYIGQTEDYFEDESAPAADEEPTLEEISRQFAEVADEEIDNEPAAVQADEIPEEETENHEATIEELEHLFSDFDFDEHEEQDDNGASSLWTIDQIDEMNQSKDDGIDDVPQFEDVSSNSPESDAPANEEIVFDDEPAGTPYQPGDGTFFGDSSGVFDFDSFDDEPKHSSKREPRRKKKQDKLRTETLSSDNNGDDVFDSL